MSTRTQSATVTFTQNDLAKYPFLKEAAGHIKKLDFKIGDVESPEFAEILARAEERLQESIQNLSVNRKHRVEIEILSFPVTIMIAIATENSFIKKRYALAEAKQAYEDLKLEPKERVLAIAQNLGWKLQLNNDPKMPHEFTLRFTDYIKNTTSLREKNWKLVNRPLSAGNVYLNKNETARLLSEEILKHIEKRLETKDLPKFPTKIQEIAERIKKLAIEKVGKVEMEGFPQTIVQTAFPPCVQALYESFTSGRHLSHIGRFTLTSFLINIGMPPENVIELFKSVSDFNARMTSYQVEHIAGDRGSRTRYKPPKCETLKTHGVCVSPDETCRRIRHPLSYYKNKAKLNSQK
jgi:DNA primase large subunit